MNDRVLGILFVAIAISCEAIGQIFFKHAADGPQDASLAAGLKNALRNRTQIGLGIVCFIVEGVFWTLALRYLDISVAHPLASIELVVIAIMSRMFLRERIPPMRWIGIVLILAGTLLVGFN